MRTFRRCLWDRSVYGPQTHRHTKPPHKPFIFHFIKNASNQPLGHKYHLRVSRGGHNKQPLFRIVVTTNSHCSVLWSQQTATVPYCGHNKQPLFPHTAMDGTFSDISKIKRLYNFWRPDIQLDNVREFSSQLTENTMGAFVLQLTNVQSISLQYVTQHCLSI